MKRSNRLILLVGVLLAAVVFVLVWVVLNSSSPNGVGVATPKTTVLVAKSDIKIGDTVTPDKVTTRQVDPAGITGTPLHDPSQLGNRRALVAVVAGAQVPAETFGQQNGTADIASQLKPGEKAISFQVDSVTGLNFLLQQGNVVDVVLSRDVGDRRDLRVVKALLQAKRVLYVSQSNIRQTQPNASASPSAAGNQAAGQALTSSVVIIAGTDQDAEIIRWFSRTDGDVGGISVALRSADDTTIEKTKGVTLQSLLQQYGLNIPSAPTPSSGQ
ncbi:MAG: Flp pilus assembly protein CpaB [Chloroflexota bacterium]|nr:Flp pilus assembly protein CpaB [Chloroflexota bacterium]